MDALVIGAGPAGLSAAMGLARRGLDVTVLERNREWTRRVCGAFLSPEAAFHLRWLGLYDEVSSRARTVRRVNFSGAGKSAVFPVGQSKEPALSISRRDLEKVLYEAALRHGVKILNGMRAVPENGGFSAIRLVDRAGPAQRFGGEVVVAADGRFSSLGAGPRRSSSFHGGWFGWNAEFSNAVQASDELSLFVFKGGYFGLSVYADGTANLCGLINKKDKELSGLDWTGFLEMIVDREIRSRNVLRGAVQAAPWKGVGPLPFGEWIGPDDEYFLAGDSAAVMDPFFGEGIGRALGSGPMLFKAFRNGAFDRAGISSARRDYYTLWRNSYGTRRRIGAWIRFALRSPRVISKIPQLLSRRASLRERLFSRIHFARV